MKTFMRIIFKEIKIQDREIVKFELNEPWKMCYEEGTKWMQMSEIEKTPTETESANSVCFWLRTAGRWMRKRTEVERILKGFFKNRCEK